MNKMRIPTKRKILKANTVTELKNPLDGLNRSLHWSEERLRELTGHLKLLNLWDK